MFRRFADRMSAAVRGTSSGDSKVEMLKSMGFDGVQAQQALEATQGDVDRAAELLLAGTAATTSTATAHTTPATNDAELQHVMQASLQAEEERLCRQAQQASLGQGQPATTTTPTGSRNTPSQQSAAATRAGQAALERFNKKNNKNTTKKKATTTITTKTQPQRTCTLSRQSTSSSSLSAHHPAVKVPAKLQDKTKEEQVLRSADRLKPYPNAVDTLHKALLRVQGDPDNHKYRNIDQTKQGYQRTLHDVPGAEALLLAMNFHKRQQTLVLERHLVDPALLYLGISALETIQASDEYKSAKQKLDFDTELKAILEQGSTDAKEAQLRAAYHSKCPSESSSGKGAFMHVKLGNDTIRRKFDGDDQLCDVLHWIASHGTVIFDKIQSRDWCLVDLNHFPVTPVDCAANANYTLQYIGFWPSGRLEVRPSTEEWKREGKATDANQGSSRGLGAAPTEALRY